MKYQGIIRPSGFFLPQIHVFEFWALPWTAKHKAARLAREYLGGPRPGYVVALYRVRSAGRMYLRRIRLDW